MEISVPLVAVALLITPPSHMQNHVQCDISRIWIFTAAAFEIVIDSMSISNNFLLRTYLGTLSSRG